MAAVPPIPGARLGQASSVWYLVAKTENRCASFETASARAADTIFHSILHRKLIINTLQQLVAKRHRHTYGAVLYFNLKPKFKKFNTNNTLLETLFM